MQSTIKLLLIFFLNLAIGNISSKRQYKFDHNQIKVDRALKFKIFFFE